jgi:phage baseplate assembly protein W
MKSISIPFRFESNPGVAALPSVQGKTATTTEMSVIARQRITDVLVTRRFERVNIPEYGAGISDLLFEPLDPLIFADYRVDAMMTLNDYVSNAEILDIQVREGTSTQYGETTLRVRVVYHSADIGASTVTFDVTPDTIFTEESEI